VVADTTYDSDALRGLIAAAGALPVIPPNPRRRHLVHFDPRAYGKRHHIEQTVNKLKQHRRIATRYDKLDTSFNAFICSRIISPSFN
jgi:transposase